MCRDDVQIAYLLAFTHKVLEWVGILRGIQNVYGMHRLVLQAVRRYRLYIRTRKNSRYRNRVIKYFLNFSIEIKRYSFDGYPIGSSY